MPRNAEQFDVDGFLIEFENWNCTLAERTALDLQIGLTNDHWKVIQSMRRFYQQTGHLLSMRKIVRIVKSDVSEKLGNSIQLARMFGSQTSRNIALISGLPKPSDCI